MEHTFEMWTPRLRWAPEHSIHIKMPRFKEAQSGPAALHSAQWSFPGISLRSPDTPTVSFSKSLLKFRLCDMGRFIIASAGEFELSFSSTGIIDSWILFFHYLQSKKRCSIYNVLVISHKLTWSKRWEFKSEVITPVILLTQSILSASVSACQDHKIQIWTINTKALHIWRQRDHRYTVQEYAMIWVSGLREW